MQSSKGGTGFVRVLFNLIIIVMILSGSFSPVFAQDGTTPTVEAPSSEIPAAVDTPTETPVVVDTPTETPVVVDTPTEIPPVAESQVPTEDPALDPDPASTATPMETLTPTLEDAITPTPDEETSLQGSVFSSCLAVTEMPVSECEALVALYDSTDGINWADNSGWKQTDTPCSWYGVSCEGGSVTGLNLTGNLLNGTLPTELGNLISLGSLSLSNNPLSGSLPLSLVQLTRLGSFDYSGTELCEPDDTGIQDWLAGIDTLSGTGTACDGGLFGLNAMALASIGYSISGRVVDGSGVGIAGVGISNGGRLYESIPTRAAIT